MKNEWLSQLHFVMKAQCFLTGELALRALVKKHIHYAILARDTSVAHLQDLTERLTYYKIPFVIRLDKLTMATLTKKKQVVMIGITNHHLAKTLIEKETLYEKTTS